MTAQLPPATGTTVKQKRSALLNGKRLEAAQPLFERTVGMVLLTISFAGSMALLQGGWQFPLNPVGLIAGFVLQVLLTAVEWMYRRQRLSWQYFGALTVDAALSIGGYSILLMPLLMRVLPFGEALNYYSSWGIIGIGAVVLAFLPESILVE